MIRPLVIELAAALVAGWWLRGRVDTLLVRAIARLFGRIGKATVVAALLRTGRST